MARWSPTQGTSAYDDPGGGMLGDYLDYMRQKQYYDFAREEAAARRAQADKEWGRELALTALERDDLRYSPDVDPDAGLPTRTYADPVYKPSMGTRRRSEFPLDALLPEAIEAQRAEPGKPVALAGELLPGGAGFAARNVYREVTAAPDRYQHITDGLYKDTGYLGEQIDLWRERLPDAREGVPELLASGDVNLNNLPRDMVWGDDWFKEARDRAVDDYMDFEKERRKEEMLQENRLELERLRQRGRTTGGGSTSLTQDAEYRAAEDAVTAWMQQGRENEGPMTDEFARQFDFPSAREVYRIFHGREKAPMTTADEVRQAGQRTLETFRAPTRTPATTTRQERGGRSR